MDRWISTETGRNGRRKKIRDRQAHADKQTDKKKEKMKEKQKERQ